MNSISDYFGLWCDNGAPGDVIICIRRNKRQQFVFQYLSSTELTPDDSTASLLKKVEVVGKTTFEDLEHAGEYFTVESNGDLTAYDEHGFIATFKRLK